MPGTLTTPEIDLERGGSPPGGRNGGGGGDGRDGGDADGEGRRFPSRVYYTGIFLAAAGIFMFFMALASSYIVRKAEGDWKPVELPAVVWLNTAVLIVSSVTLERARKFLKHGDARSFGRWWGITTLLGIAFLAGQVIAWRQLAAAGVFMSTNPASSFFYLLTGAHGLHLLGGVLALLYVTVRGVNYARVTRLTAADVTGIYWHFMDGLWVFLLLLLHLGR
jgi:cytochrome c oxidase subunit 3